MSGAATVRASRDKVTGDIYVPARRFAADGSLRQCEQFDVPADGVLLAWTEYQGVTYGLLQLSTNIQIQNVLMNSPRVVGERYIGVLREGDDLVFEGYGAKLTTSS